MIDVDEKIAVVAARIKHERLWGRVDFIVYPTTKREGARVLDSDFKELEDAICLV